MRNDPSVFELVAENFRADYSRQLFIEIARLRYRVVDISHHRFRRSVMQLRNYGIYIAHSSVRTRTAQNNGVDKILRTQ